MLVYHVQNCSHVFILQGRDGLPGSEGQKGEQGFPVSLKKILP